MKLLARLAVNTSPCYNTLVSCVTDALKEQLSNFGDWESVDKHALEKSVPNNHLIPTSQRKYSIIIKPMWQVM